jgi:hypothetical protein
MADDGGAKVAVGTTGGDSETEKRLPITVAPGAERRVVMRLESGGRDGRSLPELRPGDLLRVTVELELTTDCKRRTERRYCVECGYNFSPTARVALFLSRDPRETSPEAAGTIKLAHAREVICSHSEHHVMVVINHADYPVQASDPAWLFENPSINLVASADHERASGREILLVGENEPGNPGKHGTVGGDKGRINAIRLRGDAGRSARLADDATLPSSIPSRRGSSSRSRRPSRRARRRSATRRDCRCGSFSQRIPTPTSPRSVTRSPRSTARSAKTTASIACRNRATRYRGSSVS